MILGVLECLGVELPLGVVGLSEEFVPKVCSGYQLGLKGNCATGSVEFLCSCLLLILITSSVGADAESASPLIL